MNVLRFKPFFAAFILVAGLGLFTSMIISQETTSNPPIELEEINNIAYYPEGSDLNSELTQLNLILPKGVENPPMFFWLGGGAWAYVNRHQEMELCRKLAKQGIAVVSVGHRLSPALLSERGRREEGIQHPEHIKDVAQAFKWVYDHANQYGYSNENIFVGGYSCGAHLATLLAADQSYLKVHNLSAQNIKGIIPVAGGYDIPHYKSILVDADPAYLDNHIKPVFGETEEDWINASPTNYLENFNTSTLLISEGDTYQYSVVFEKALSEKGFKDFQVLNFHNETHNTLWTRLSKDEENPYRNFIADFIKSKSNDKTVK